MHNFSIFSSARELKHTNPFHICRRRERNVSPVRWGYCALAHHCPLAQNTLRFVGVCQRCLSYFRCGSFSRINTPKARKTRAFTSLCSAEERAAVLHHNDYSRAWIIHVLPWGKEVCIECALVKYICI